MLANIMRNILIHPEKQNRTMVEAKAIKNI